MEFEKFLQEYSQLDIKDLEREQLESFREIFVDNGRFDEALKISEWLYENNLDDEAAIISYVDNLMHLERNDEALYVLYKAKDTAQTLLMEGIIYKEENILDVAESKFKKALALVADDTELKRFIEHSLANVYSEVGKGTDAYEISLSLFNEEKNVENFRNVIDNLIYMARYEEAIECYENHSNYYQDLNIHYAMSFAYNRMGDKEKAKYELEKCIALDSDFLEAYASLGYLSSGKKAIEYFEKYIEMPGHSTAIYLELIKLYQLQERYSDIRKMVRTLLTEQGIDTDTLYIAITALNSLYETEKIYEIYKAHQLIQEDVALLGLALYALSEEDYVDFVIEEINKYHHFVKYDDNYQKALVNVYDITGDKQIYQYLKEIESEHPYATISDYHNQIGYDNYDVDYLYEAQTDCHHDGDCDCCQ